MYGHESVAELLIGAADEVDALGTNGGSALHYTVSYNNETLIQMLLKNGADPTLATSPKNTARHIASALGYLGLVRILTESGADLNVQNEDGRTALHWACFKHSDLGFKVIEYLLDKGSDPFIRDKLERTPLGVAETNSTPGVVALLRKRMSDQ